MANPTTAPQPCPRCGKPVWKWSGEWACESEGCFAQSPGFQHIIDAFETIAHPATLISPKVQELLADFDLGNQCIGAIITPAMREQFEQFNMESPFARMAKLVERVERRRVSQRMPQPVSQPLQRPESKPTPQRTLAEISAQPEQAAAESPKQPRPDIPTSAQATPNPQKAPAPPQPSPRRKKRGRRRDVLLEFRRKIIREVSATGVTGPAYAKALHEKTLKPPQRWISSEGCPSSYPEAYRLTKWQHRIHDEKSKYSE